MRARAQLVEHRRRLVGDNVRLTHRLTRALKDYFPHVGQWVDDKETSLFGDSLVPWPPLKAVHLARRASLERFFRNHHVRDAEGLAKRLQAIQRATPLTPEAGLIAPHALLVQALVSQLRVTLHASEDFDNVRAPRAPSHPDFPVLASLPGAVFAPRLLVACGAHHDLYTSADALQQYAGLAPVSERRGNKAWVHGRLQGPTFLRQTFVE